MFLYRVISAFDKAGLDYALVGGHAVALHGAVRGTIDLDFVVKFRESDFEAVEKALQQLNLQPRLPLKAKEVFRFRKEYILNRNLIAWSFSNPKDPSEIVDIIITHDLSEMKVTKIRTGKLTIKILALDDLIKMKNDSGRPQDLEDVRALQELKR